MSRSDSGGGGRRRRRAVGIAAVLVVSVSCIVGLHLRERRAAAGRQHPRPTLVIRSASESQRPPHGQVRLGIAQEVSAASVEELMANLGRKDDLEEAWFASLHFRPVSGLGPPEAAIVARMLNVQGLLEEGRADPDAMVPSLRQALEEAVEEWPVLRDARRKAGRRGQSPPEESRHDNIQRRMLALPYLLAELADYDAMPVIMRSAKGAPLPAELVDRERYGRDSRWRYWPISGQMATSPGVPYYALHVLVSTFPEDRLSETARRLRDDYLAASIFVLPPRVEKVAALRGGSAATEASAGGSASKSDRTVEVRVWPYQYGDGTYYAGTNGFISERTQELFAKMEAFIVEAFPDYEP